MVKYPEIKNADRKANVYIFKSENFGQVMAEIEGRGLEIRGIHFERYGFGRNGFSLHEYWIAVVRGDQPQR